MKLAASLIACLSMGATALAAQQKPNIVVILTDDQDLLLGSMDYMPLVKKHLTDQGMYFNHHYATVALCCPSRASMWTGKAAHNTNITDLHPPYGMERSYKTTVFETDRLQAGIPSLLTKDTTRSGFPCG